YYFGVCMAIEVLSPKEHYRSYLNEKMSRNNPKRIYNDGGEKSQDILDLLKFKSKIKYRD
ncbi:hypothetical protein J7K55_03855, partial [Candidatus Aerophobetes bacterium]|nr:hypothetical protein [Candidatus Aerophobetes bacterium]